MPDAMPATATDSRPVALPQAAILPAGPQHTSDVPPSAGMEVEEPPGLAVTDTIPTEPMPEPTKPIAQLTLDEIYTENLGYIRLRQDKDTRCDIEAHLVVAAYYDLAIEMDFEMPAVPQAGMGLGVGRKGPWDIYMHFECAKQFADAHPTMEIEGSTIKVQAVLAIERSNIPASATSAMGISVTPYLVEAGGFMDLQYPSGLAFKLIHKNAIISMLRSKGIQVYRGARLQVKMRSADGEDAVPMGTGLMTDRINLTVCPMYTDFANYAWPPAFWIHSDEGGGEDFRFLYRLGGKNAETLHSTYDGCKGLLVDCRTDCSISGHKARATENDGKRKAAPEAAERAAERQAKGKEGVLSFLAGRRKKNETDCKHLAAGTCRSGSQCGFLHAGGNEHRDGRTNSTWEAIRCQIDRSASGWCKAAPHCIFSPCAERQRAAKAAAEMFGEVALKLHDRGTHPPLYQ